MTDNSEKLPSLDSDLESSQAPENTETTAAEAPIADSFTQILDNEQLLTAVAKLGFTKPSPIQAQAIPLVLKGHDIIAQAQTGSGKTASFVLPLLSRIYKELGEEIPKNPFALILSPTRELAVQISEVIQSLSSIKPPLLIGGSDMKAQESGLEKDCRIVVGTPGRVLDFIRQKKLILKECRFFVLDEADEMLSMGFLQDVRLILSKLPDKRQGMFVSATMTPRVDMLANSFLNKPEVVVALANKDDKQNIEHFYIEVKNDILAKPAALSDIIETWRPRSAIIFCNTKSDTELVEVLLRKRGFDARRINSDLSQSQRNRIMKQIRAGELQFLVATDIAARGLDIEQIDLIINYSIHEQPETYVHRTGRTGRAGRFGKAISLVGAQDFGYFHHLTKIVKVNFEKITLPSDAEVIEARLTHLYEILRKGNIALKDRDTALAQTLLKELGNIDSPTEELLAVTAKLCRFAIGHRLNETTKSLEEEVEKEASSNNDEKPQGRRDRDNKRGRDNERGARGRDRDNGSRGNDRDRKARSNSDDDRGNRRDPKEEIRPEKKEISSAGDNRGNRRDDSRNRPERRDSRPERRDDRREGYKDSRRDDRRPPRNDSRGNDNRGNESRSSDNRTSQTKADPRSNYRVYFGQGTSHGMTEQTFLALASDMGEVEKQSLRNLKIDNDHGYVEIRGTDAQKLIANLNGIEYNGATLPVRLENEIKE